VDVEAMSCDDLFREDRPSKTCGETTRMKTGREFEASRSNESTGTYSYSSLFSV
jgi:hypothetical protein